MGLGPLSFAADEHNGAHKRQERQQIAQLLGAGDQFARRNRARFIPPWYRIPQDGPGPIDPSLRHEPEHGRAVFTGGARQH